MKKAKQQPPLPTYLQRAIVSLPPLLHEPERPMQDRIVFFEAYSDERASRLEQLLSLAWRIDATGWSEQGWIYNFSSAYERLHEGLSFLDKSHGDLCMFDTGSGGDLPFAVGPDRTHFARRADVDLFVTPRLAARLLRALDVIEAMYAAEPARRRKAARAAAA